MAKLICLLTIYLQASPWNDVSYNFKVYIYLSIIGIYLSTVLKGQILIIIYFT